MPHSPRIVSFDETVSSNRQFLKKNMSYSFNFQHKRGCIIRVASLSPLHLRKAIFLFEDACGTFMKAADATIHILFWIAIMLQWRNHQTLSFYERPLYFMMRIFLINRQSSLQLALSVPIFFTTCLQMEVPV
jgi:hypothetical protein